MNDVIIISKETAQKLLTHTNPLKQLKGANRLRTEELWKAIEDWTPTDWACAVAGETGELCNKVKKLHRGDDIDLDDLAEEAADVVIYLDLLCQRLGIDLTNAIVNKFNKKSDEMGCGIKIYYY